MINWDLTFRSASFCPVQKSVPVVFIIRGNVKQIIRWRLLLLEDEKDRYSLLIFQNHVFPHLNRQKKKSYQNNVVCLLPKSANAVIKIGNKPIGIFFTISKVVISIESGFSTKI